MKQNNAFTLLEMSMVIAILALILGTIALGSSMIRSNEMTSMASDVEGYTMAISNFRDKYKYWPGDMYQAHTVWGVASGGCPNGSGNPGEVCYGDGNGHVCDTNNDNNLAEVHMEWIELANAGFIKGSYSYTPANSAFVIGTGSPKSVITGATYLFYYATCPLGDGLYSTVAPYAMHWMSVGALYSTSGIAKPSFTGSESYNIDKKFDDGMPGTGEVRGARNATAGGYTANCQSSATPTSALYNQNDSNINCYLMFGLPD